MLKGCELFANTTLFLTVSVANHKPINTYPEGCQLTSVLCKS